MVSAVASARASRQSLGDAVHQQMGAVRVALRADGHADDNAVLDAISDWVAACRASDGTSDKTGPTASTGGESDSVQENRLKVAGFCAELKMALQAYLIEVSNALGTLSSPDAINSENANKQQVANQITSDDQIEAPEVDGIEAVLAAGPSAHLDPFAATFLKETATKLPSSNSSITSDGRGAFTMLDFVLNSLGADGSPTAYSVAQRRQMLLKLQAMLSDAVEKADVDTEWVQTAATAALRQPVSRDQPKASVGTITAPSAVDAFVAAFIYSVDAKECNCASLEECRARQLDDAIAGAGRKHRKAPARPANSKVLGYNGNHWAMMNWVLRVAGDGSSGSFSEQERSDLESALVFFAPLIRRLQEALTLLPRQARVVFRGVNVAISAKYHQGTEVTFAPFTSTSLEGTEAMKFMGSGGTYFVISTRSGGLIADFSHYPEQAELLLNVNTKFIVTGKMSRTLLQLLGNDFDVVFMTEVEAPGTAPLPDEALVKLLVEATRTTEFVYSAYTKRYVEGRVSEERPPSRGLGEENKSDVKVLPLYKATDHFIEVSGSRQMLLLGAGGAGKTSALVACLCHLMNKKDRSKRPLLPIFVSLPAVGAALHTHGGLDQYVRGQLLLTPSAFEALRQLTRCVLLLDSLDEVVPEPSTDATILLTPLLDPKQNPWAAGCKAIVSCRTEAIDAVKEIAATPHLAIASPPTAAQPPAVVYHVWPFSSEDRVQFMQNVAAERIAQLAAQEAQSQFESLRDTFQLDDAELEHPCILAIAAKVTSTFRPTAKDGLQNEYTLYDRFVRSSLLKGKAGEDGNVDVEQVAFAALEDVATTMMTRQVWQVPVSDVLDTIECHFEENRITSPTPAEVLAAYPSRCENLNVNTSMWGFWHRTVAEFLLSRRDGADFTSLPVATAFQRLKADVGRLRHPVGDLSAVSVVTPLYRRLKVPFVGEVLRVLDCGGMVAPESGEAGVASFFELVSAIRRLDELVLPTFSLPSDQTATFKQNIWFAQLRNEEVQETTVTGTVVPPINTSKLNVGHLNLSTAFNSEDIVALPDGFLCEGTMERVTLPKFPKLQVVPERFLANETLADLHTAPLVGVFPAAFRYGKGFLQNTKNLLVCELDFSPKTVELEDDFLAGSGIANVNFDFPAATPDRSETSPVAIGQNCLGGAIRLSVVILSNVSHVGNKFCFKCPALEVIVIRSMFAEMNLFSHFAMGCPNLINVIAETPPKLNLTLGETVHPCIAVAEDFLAEGGVAVADFSKTAAMILGASHHECADGFCRDTPRLESFKFPRKLQMHRHRSHTTPPQFFMRSGIQTLDLSGLQQLSSMSQIGDDFLTETPRLTELTAPTLSNLRSIGNNFLRKTDLSALPRGLVVSKHIQTIGDGFLADTFCDADLSGLFEEVESVGDDFFYKYRGDYTLPDFPHLQRIGSNFMASTHNCRENGLNLGGDQMMMPVVHTIGDNFCKDVVARRVTLPKFDHVLKVGSSFLASIRALVDDEPQRLPDGTYTEEMRVVFPEGLPSFERLSRLHDRFMSGVAVEKLDMSGCFPRIVAVGGLFLENARVSSLTLPASFSGQQCKELQLMFLYGATIKELVGPIPTFPAVEDIGESCFSNLKIPELDLRNAFTNAKSIGPGFGDDLLTRDIHLPEFRHVEVVQGDFLSQLSRLPEQDTVPNPDDPLPPEPEPFERLEMPSFAAIEVFYGRMLAGARVRQVVFPSDALQRLKLLDSGCFSHMPQLITVELPRELPALRGIGHDVLANLPQLKTITLPRCHSLKTIANSFMKGTSAIESIDLKPLVGSSGALNHVGTEFLGECASLESIELPAEWSVTTLGEGFLAGTKVEKTAPPALKKPQTADPTEPT